MGGKVFKRKLVYCLRLQLQLFTAIKKVLPKCRAHLKAKFKWVFVTIYSLMMTPFSHDFIEMEID